MLYRIPLLKDHHTHIALYSALGKFQTLQGIKNEKDAYSLLAQQNKEFSIILSWNSGAYTIDPEKLESFPPMLICNTSLHEFKINQKGKEYLYSKGFSYIADNLQNQDWVERNLPDILTLLSQISKITLHDIEAFFSVLEKMGVYYAEEMLLPDSDFLNIIINSPYKSRTKLWVDLSNYKNFNREEQKHIEGIKLFTDGAIGAKTAALEEKYLTGEKGFLLYTNDEFTEKLTQAFSYGKKIAIHAIGELAIEQIIDCLKNFTSKKYDGLIRIEHAQFITEMQAYELKKMGITLSMRIPGKVYHPFQRKYTSNSI